jgi:hypothetical protein
MAEPDKEPTVPFRNSMIGPAITVVVVLVGVTAGYFLSSRRLPSGADGADGDKKRVCIDIGPEGQLYFGRVSGVAVADRDGRTLGGWESQSRVTALAVDEHGNVYTAGGGLIEKRSGEGESLLVWGFGGCDGDPFETVTGLAVAEGSVFVADAGAKLVYRFDYEGRPLGEIGSKESDPDGRGFEIPSPFFDCAVRDGVLYVTNTGRHRVEMFDFDGKRLGHWGEFGSEPRQFPGCCNPTNIALAPDGRIVVSQKGAPVVKVFSREGRFLGTLGKGEFPANARGIDLAVTNEGRILALDPVAGRLHSFTLVPPPEGGTE